MASQVLYMRLTHLLITPSLTPRPFLPLDELEKIITAESVKTELTPRWYHKVFPARVEEIVKNAKKIFAILTLIAEPDEIWSLLHDGMKDGDLPLSRSTEDDISSILVSQGGKKTFQSFQKWKVARVNEFLSKQWIVEAPVLDAYGKHYSLNEQCAIPIVNSKEIGGGQFSIVHKGEIHPAHQTGLKTEGGSLRVAIKEFRKKGPAAFDREKENLEKIHGIQHEHLIRYHATYQWSDRYCVVFPWADGGNLSEFWKSHDNKEKTTQFTLWSLRQIHGLAAALVKLHKENCRHGDLKPDNILYFDGSEETLVIADVGISRFHKDATIFRKGGTNTQATTPSYQGPEVFGAPDAPRPRRYDIWSLGCILLEFLIWFLYDLAAVEAFHKTRSTGDNSYFYKHSADGTFETHPKVLEAIERLRSDPRCEANAFGALLTLIKDHMLQIEVKNRYTADQIVGDLQRILENSETTPSYLPTYSSVSSAKPAFF